MAESTKQFRVEKVVRDEFGKAIWVRIQCFQKINVCGALVDKILHDTIFMPDGRGWVYIHNRVLKDFIPLNRYMKMTKIAAAIFYEK